MVADRDKKRGGSVARGRHRRRRHGQQPCARLRGRAGREAGRRRRSRSASSATSSRRRWAAPAIDTVDALLDAGVDAVTIAAPTHLHHEMALACIARGVHVLVEKPIASSVEEGREIIAAARKAGVTLMVGHVERFNPAVEAIKNAIRGEDILSIAITRVGPFPPRMSNVGVVIDLAVHDIDLIRWFTDSDIIEVQPQLSSAVAEREDIALLQFRTASGVLAHINTNWLTPFKARNVTVATRGKYVMGDLLTRQVTECFGFQPDGSYSMRHLSVGHAEPLRAELMAFVGAIASGKPPAVTGEQGVASLEIAIQCLEATPAQGCKRRPLRSSAKARAASPADAPPFFRNYEPDEPAYPSRHRAHSFHRCCRAAPPSRQRHRRRGRARARALPVRHGPGSAGLREGPRGLLRREACDQLRQRHRCAVAGADGQGHRPGRRGVLPGRSPSAPRRKSLRCSAPRRSLSTSTRRRSISISRASSAPFRWRSRRG